MIHPLLTLSALALGGPVSAAPSFSQDVVPVLTRAGCNQGACHGKLAGQNGFRLSLRGYAAADDFRSLTREFAGRRLDPVSPENSLLLLKATGQVAHDGGMIFGRESREYQTLLAWIQKGAPGPNEREPALTKLELVRAERAVRVGDERRLLAWATFSDGSRRDVTWLTQFEANDPAVMAVTPQGVATAHRPGLGVVRAAFLTEVAVATFPVPYAHTPPAAAFAHAPHPVDDAVFAQLNALRLAPSERCTDAEFVRRVTLDVLGRLPTSTEVTEFLADSHPDKRAKLIDAWLARPEFADYWALFLADLFQNRRERDHDVRGVEGVRLFHAWLREQVAVNRPWHELARAVLTAEGAVTANPAVGYFEMTIGEHRDGAESPAGETVAQAFLGTRIGCAKCHNHPLERYTQDDYYHFAAFFGQVQLQRRPPKDGGSRLQTRDGDAPTARQPRTGQRLRAQPLDRTQPAFLPGHDPRTTLANWITRPDTTLFADAFVNRIWKHYLGVGLVEPVDDLRATNPPTNPVLMATLRGEFVSSGYDMKQLMRLILTSRTYQLSSRTTPENAADTRFYSHFPVRRLPAEVFLDAISDVTEHWEHFPGYPVGMRAIQVPDPGVASRFLALFGRSERTTACACERTEDVTLSQLLNLANGPELNHKIRHGTWLRAALRDEPDDARLLDALMLRTLARPATPAERKLVADLHATGEARLDLFADFLWAALNSKDFAFNH